MSKRKPRTMLWSLLVATLSGCTTVSAFEHAPTSEFIAGAGRRAFVEGAEFVQGGVLLVPDFAAFTKRSDERASWIILYGEKGRTVTLVDATLTGNQSGLRRTVAVNQEIRLERPSFDPGIFSAAVPLFDSSNVDKKAWNGDDDVTLVIGFRIAQDTVVRQMTFVLTRRSYPVLPSA